MLVKAKSSKNVAYKYSMFLPILIGLIFICSFNQQVQAQHVSNDKTVLPIIAKENVDTIIIFDPETFQETMQTFDNPIYSEVDNMPLFKGCDDGLERDELKKCAQMKLLNYIFSKLKYPAESRKAGVEGMVVAQFTVYSNGAVGDVKIVKNLDKACDEEVFKVVQSMPNWIPGSHDGKNVHVQIKLPVRFKVDNKK